MGSTGPRSGGGSSAREARRVWARPASSAPVGVGRVQHHRYLVRRHLEGVLGVREAPTRRHSSTGGQERAAQQPDRPLVGERPVVVAHVHDRAGVAEDHVELGPFVRWHAAAQPLGDAGVVGRWRLAGLEDAGQHRPRELGQRAPVDVVARDEKLSPVVQVLRQQPRRPPARPPGRPPARPERRRMLRSSPVGARAGAGAPTSTATHRPTPEAPHRAQCPSPGRRRGSGRSGPGRSHGARSERWPDAGSAPVAPPGGGRAARRPTRRGRPPGIGGSRP